MKTTFFLQAFFFVFLSASQASACSLKDTRVCDIDTLLRAYSRGHVVTYQENSTSDPAAAAQEDWVIGAPDVIHLGDTRQYDDDELLFLLAHEFGHSMHEYGRAMLESIAAPEDRALPDLALYQKYAASLEKADTRATAHQLEYEADAFAVKVMAFYHKDPIAAMSGVLKINVSSPSHPSKRHRINRAKEALASLADTRPALN